MGCQDPERAHQFRDVLLVLLRADGCAPDPRPDRAHRVGRDRAGIAQSVPTPRISGGGERSLLAHGRPALGDHLRPAVRGEVTMTDKAVTQTWLVLVAITVGSWWLAPAQYSDALRASVPITALV